MNTATTLLTASALLLNRAINRTKKQQLRQEKLEENVKEEYDLLSTYKVQSVVPHNSNTNSNVFIVNLQGDCRRVFLTCLKPDLWKVLVENKQSSVLERNSWAVQPGVEDQMRYENDVMHMSGAEVSLELSDDGNFYTLTPLVKSTHETKIVQIRINVQHFMLDFIDAQSGSVFQSGWQLSIGHENLKSSIEFNYDDRQQVFGLGEKTGLSVNKKGRKYTMWNYDNFGYEVDEDPLYQSIPFALFVTVPGNNCSIEEDHQMFHSIFIDNPGRQNWDLIQNDRINVQCDSDPCRIYVSLAGDVSGLVRNYVKLTGTSPLPPLYALGYHQCKYSYETDQIVKRIATTFRDEDIPCDVIYLDIDYMKEFKCFTWHDTNFSDPKGLLQWLTENKFRVVVIIDPGIMIEDGYSVYDSGLADAHFCKWLDARTNDVRDYVSHVWAGHSLFPDFTQQKTRDWWGKLYHDLVDTGVSGFWNDMNEPACFTPETFKTFHLDVLHNCDGQPTTHQHCHNIYGMQMARASYEGLSRLQVNERSFVVTRAGYAGIQRFAWTWTGDNTSSFEHLAMSIPMMINMSLSGQPFTGADIGGFCGDAYGELYARWISFGSIVYPFCRTHSMKGSRDQEPFSFSDEVKQIARKFIKLRYRLMPYLYTCAYFSSKFGDPMLRPLFYEFPATSMAFEAEFVDTQVFVGPDLLVCPVVQQGVTERRVYLPPGCKWYCFYTREEFSGDQIISVKVPIDSLPIFVREGAVIPMRENARETVYETLRENLVLELFGEVTTSSKKSFVYLDDGISLEYQTSEQCYGLYEIVNRELKLIDGKGYPPKL